MHIKVLRICTVVTSILLTVFVGAYANAAEPEAAKNLGQVEKMELRISKDGKAIVDQNGRVVARFAEGTLVKKGEVNVQGCLCCTNDCLIYDRNGVCIKTVRSCTYDFDCSCRN